MSSQDSIEQIANQEYNWGFVSDFETDVVAPGLDVDVIRMISA